MRDAVLMVVEGPSRGAHAALDAGDVVIGRDRECALRIADPQCSRRHARVVSTPTGPRVEDLGSTNGTFLNEARLEAGSPLMPRDRIRIGATVVELQGTPAGPIPRTPPPPPGTTLDGPGAAPPRLSEIPGRRDPESAIHALTPSPGPRTRAYVVTVVLIAAVAVMVAAYFLTR
ncbi:MAG: FHA domain-containing protein [Thermoleophilia bacterium]|nr:FHA domain-containing protein [Thermoleophilia bacterium]